MFRNTSRIASLVTTAKQHECFAGAILAGRITRVLKTVVLFSVGERLHPLLPPRWLIVPPQFLPHPTLLLPRVVLRLFDLLMQRMRDAAIGEGLAVVDDVEVDQVDVGEIDVCE